MNNLNSVVELIQSANKSGVDTIGAIIQWMVPGNTKIRRSQLEEQIMNLSLFTKDEIDQMLPGVVTKKRAFTRAIQRYNADCRNKEAKTFKEYKKIAGLPPGVTCYGLTVLKTDSEKKQFGLLNSGWVGLIEGQVKSNDPALRSEIIDRMDTFLGASEIRSMMTRLCMMKKGFSTRKGGGSYFVPTDPTCDSINAIEKVSGCVQAYCNEMFLTVLPILGGAATVNNVKNVFDENLRTEIERFKRDVDDFFSSDTKKQKGATVRRLTEVKELRKFALSYEGILGPMVLELNEGLKKLEEYVEGAVKDSLEKVHGVDLEDVQEAESSSSADSSEERDESPVEGEAISEPTAEDVQKFLAKLDKEAGFTVAE